MRSMIQVYTEARGWYLSDLHSDGVVPCHPKCYLHEAYQLSFHLLHTRLLLSTSPRDHHKSIPRTRQDCNDESPPVMPNTSLQGKHQDYKATQRVVHTQAHFTA